MRAKNIAFGGIEFEYFLDMGFFVVSAQLRRLFLRATGLDMPECRKNIYAHEIIPFGFHTWVHLKRLI